jgi:hypothetical protein
MRALVLLLLTAAPLAAEPMRAVTQVYDQIIAYDLPEGFAPAYENEQGGSYIQEAIQQGESLDGWTQMVTLTGARGQAAADQIAVLNNIAAGYEAACPSSFGAAMLTEVAVPGAGPGLAVWLGCGTVAGAGYGEAMVAVITAGSQDLYTLQWAIRFNPNPEPARYSPGVWDPRLAALIDGFRLCDPVAGEGPPYPSCR